MTTAIEFESQQVGRSRIAPIDLELLAEVTGLSEDACLDRLRSYRFAELADAWRRSGPATPAEVHRFYGETDLYLWELLAWNGSAEYDRYRRRIARLAERWPAASNPRALDYGSGVGTTALQLARLGYDVTIADIAGPTLDFARERLSRHGVAADVIEVDGAPALPHAQFDVVVSFDVIEHVPDPGAVARALSGSLKRGGGATIMASFDAQGEEWPHHLPAGNARFGGHRWRLYLQQLGLALVDDALYRKQGRVAVAFHRVQYAIWRASGLYVTRLAR
jgi:2-polyprenyl-3-methyl-5-hydroxy-6-metoxy-1,4-benzoquinol methylase